MEKIYNELKKHKSKWGTKVKIFIHYGFIYIVKQNVCNRTRTTVIYC